MVKIADFGLARQLPSGSDFYPKSSTSNVPIRYSAPECLRRNQFSTHSDKWSYAVLLYQMFSYGAIPWREYNPTSWLSECVEN